MATIREVALNLGHIAEQARVQGGPKAAEAMGRQLQREITMDELIRYTHPPAVKTPSPPGQPPALVSGALRRSVHQMPVTGARRVNTYRFEVTVGASTVYARIQELGGWAGKNHRTHLPPRPYLSSAARRAQEKIRRAGLDAFVKAIGF